MHAREEILAWRGREVVDADGSKVGRLEEIYLDAETDQPTWAAVKTGLFGSRQTFVPLEGADLHEGHDVRVAYDKQTIKDAPSIDPHGELSPEEEDRLFDHYGARPPSAAGVGEAERGQGAADVGAGAPAGTRGASAPPLAAAGGEPDAPRGPGAGGAAEPGREAAGAGAPAGTGQASAPPIAAAVGEQEAAAGEPGAGGGAASERAATGGAGGPEGRGDAAGGGPGLRRPRIRRHIVTEELSPEGEVIRRETRTEEEMSSGS